MERRTRRRFLGGLAAVPAVVALAGVATSARSRIAALRPSARGRSGGVCAQCGAEDHTMLDAGCASAPRVM